MARFTVRNPTARWVFRLVVGLVLTCAVLGWANSLADPCDDVSRRTCHEVPYAQSLGMAALFAGWFPLGFFFAAFLSWYARLDVTDEGIRTRSLFGTRIYPWPTIQDVRMHTTKYTANGIPSGADREVQIMVNARWHGMPVPRAGWFVGRDLYEDQAQAIWNAWRDRVGPPRSQAAGW